ncbi:MAG: TIGR03768 family metallophosphoesterase [Burkholderiales bacterium]|nr:TIGR03768 family metallophosphoesterase [Burkholderiales bacterium]
MDRRNFLKSSVLTIPIASIYGLPGCGGGRDSGSVPLPQSYPIDLGNVITTAQGTVVPGAIPAVKIQMKDVADFNRYGYGNWIQGSPLNVVTRTDITSISYSHTGVIKKTKLLKFFAITDIHITDKESPCQLIYLQQLTYPAGSPVAQALGSTQPWSWMTSVYSPVMLYTTQVLDAAIQTVNALHKEDPIDFGISLGDACNSTQYNELRWYIDVIDGKVIDPSSGAHVGTDNIDYQKPFQAVGLDKSIPFYQTLGNHDHFCIGSFSVYHGARTDLAQSYTGDTIFATGDVLINPSNLTKTDYYMGVIDGSTPYGDIVGAGPVANFSTPPTVVPDPDRRSLTKAEWVNEFFNTTSSPVGHGFNLIDQEYGEDFACYSFVPKSNVPLKVIVLDVTQTETDGADTTIHGHGFLDQARWDWLKQQLAEGKAADQLMIISAHIPIAVAPEGSYMEWWDNQANAVTLQELIVELQTNTNVLMWIAGHRHVNAVKAFVSPDPIDAPEKGFWQVETSSLRDYPQQFRTFEIYVNSDYTISIVATNVDPAVQIGTPAATSRKYAVAATQIANDQHIYQTPSELIDLITQKPVVDAQNDPVSDPSIAPMDPTGSYNAELIKQLSSAMTAKLKALFP